jgi:hypothetical protein
MTMTKNQFALLMERIFESCTDTREAGQKEYAGGEDAFGNFNRLADELGIDRKKILWVFLTKHRDGVVSYINGHKSQREDVRGRIKDMIVYLCLLWGMVNEDEGKAYDRVSLGEDVVYKGDQVLKDMDTVKQDPPVPLDKTQQSGYIGSHEGGRRVGDTPIFGYDITKGK